MKVYHTLENSRDCYKIFNESGKFEFEGQLWIRNFERTQEGFFADIYIGTHLFDQCYLNLDGRCAINGLYTESELIGQYKVKAQYTDLTIKRNMRKLIVQWLNQDKFVTVYEANEKLKQLIPKIKQMKKQYGNTETVQYLRNRLVVYQRIAHNCL